MCCASMRCTRCTNVNLEWRVDRRERSHVCKEVGLTYQPVEEELMRRFLIPFVIAIGCAAVLDVQTGAQTSESKTRVKTEHAKTMTYTGCVQTGTETRTYTLQNVVPISKTETSGTAGTTTTTTYALVP